MGSVQITESPEMHLQRIVALEDCISEREESMRVLKSAIFGRSSEKHRPADPVPGQLCLPFEKPASVVAETTSTKARKQMSKAKD